MSQAVRARKKRALHKKPAIAECIQHRLSTRYLKGTWGNKLDTLSVWTSSIRWWCIYAPGKTAHLSRLPVFTKALAGRWAITPPFATIFRISEHWAPQEKTLHVRHMSTSLLKEPHKNQNPTYWTSSWSLIFNSSRTLVFTKLASVTISSAVAFPVFRR